MSPSDYVGIATCITATAAAAVSIIVAVRQGAVKSQVEEVHAAVSMSNGTTMGQAVEQIGRDTATAETPPAA